MIFAKNFAGNYEKKLMLGTSDTWSMSHSSQQPCAAYYIEDCRISSVRGCNKSQDTSANSRDSGNWVSRWHCINKNWIKI